MSERLREEDPDSHAAEPGRPRSASLLEAIRSRAIGPNVLALGITSLFTDISSEMVAAILPVWLVRELQFGTLEFGAIDGLWRGWAGVVGALVAIGSDGRRRHKLAALLGYAISTASRVALLIVPVAFSPVAAVLCLDRLGKGIRTPPRDAMISLASQPRDRARAFGLHRSLDAAGRLSGPVFAYAILKQAPGAFDAVFFVSLCSALVGLATLALLVVDGRGDAVRALAPEPARFTDLWKSRELRWFTLSIGLLSAMTVSESFFVLVLERRGQVSVENVPLFFTALGSIQILFTLPLSRLADRLGRKQVLIAGHTLLLAAYSTLLVAGGQAFVPWVCVVLLGSFLAATDGVGSAMASLLISSRQRAGGMAAVACVGTLAKAGASLVFGALWEGAGIGFGLTAFALGLLLGILVASLSPWSDRAPSHAP